MSWTDGVGIEVGESGAWVGRIRFRVTRLQRASPVLVMYAVLLSLALTIDLVSPADPTEQHSLWMLLGSACVVAATQLVPPSRQAVTLSANGVTVSGSRRSPSSYLTWPDIEPCRRAGAGGPASGRSSSTRRAAATSGCRPRTCSTRASPPSAT
jgi:hypothetical protein